MKTWKTNDTVFKGYGIIIDDKLVWHCLNGSAVITAIVRDRDYPEGKVVRWCQSKAGSDTVYESVE